MTVNNERAENSVEFYRPQGCRYVKHDAKVADFTAADTNKHITALTGLPANTIAAVLAASRVAGTGNLYVYMDAAVTYGSRIMPQSPSVGLGEVVSTDGASVAFANSVANDDWNVWCTGYWVNT